MRVQNTDGLFTQLSTLIDRICDDYNALSERARATLRRKGFERRHIGSLLKVKQAMIDANYTMTGNKYEKEEKQGSLF